MEKNNINRLLHIFVPFIIMVMIQNLLRLLWDKIGFAGTLGEIIAFVIASAAAVIFFSLTSPADTETPPHAGAVRSILHLLFCTAMLVVSMYVTSAVTVNYTTRAVSLTPLYALSVLLIHPIIEEYIFRGLFYSELRRINPIFGIIAQAIMFAIIHDTIDGMTYALAAGIFLGATMEKTGRLWVTTVAHAMINLRSLVYIKLLAEQDVVRKGIDIGIVSAGFTAFLVLLIIKNIPAAPKTGEPEGEVEWTEAE